MDCGPACLRMIASHYGREFSQSRLREMCLIGKAGVSMLGIADAAEKIGLRSLPVKLAFKKLAEEAPLPCVAHWNQEHFVVVYRITKNRIYVADPAVGLMVYTLEEFLQGVSGAAGHTGGEGLYLLLETTPTFHEIPLAGGTLAGETSRGLSFFLLYLRPYQRLVRQLLMAMGVGLLIELILPFLAQAVVDHGIGNLDLKFIYVLLTAQLVLSLSQMAGDMVRSWILLHVGARISVSMVADFLTKLLRLPLPFFDSRTAGDIMQRIGDHRRVKNFLMSSSLDIVFSLLSFLVFGVVLAVYSWVNLVVFVVLAVLSVGWLAMFLKQRRMLDQKRFALEARERDNLYEMVSAMQEIKIQGIQRPKRAEWEDLSIQGYKLEARTLALRQAERIGLFFLNNLRNILLTFISARAVIQGDMTLGMMLAAQYIAGQLNGPVLGLIEFMHSAQEARLSLERMQEIYSQPEEPEAHEQKPCAFPPGRTLTLQGISFRYPGAGQTDVLTNLNLQIPEGRVTAIVGSSGSGKTTLLKLLLGLYQPSRGTIYLDHTPLPTFDAHAWRQRCGVVMQDGHIFSATLARNIAPGSAPIDPMLLQYAVQFACLTDYVRELPLGVETRLGADGQGLSGGQRQRLLIARACYRNPEFLLLDEATSALDANNEHAIQDHLRQFTSGRTVVVIAHRLSTVKNADQIVVLHAGQIVEIGNHADLVARRGAYYQLVYNQLELETSLAYAA